MNEKRNNQRKKVEITTFVRKTLADGRYQIMEFISGDLSRGGVFIVTENLTILDLGEELGILVDDKGKKYFEGRAKVVRSARIFSAENDVTQSGFGLMFMEPDAEFEKMLNQKLDDIK
ncbi:MAG: PilZ domain-containing protein [Spirochaetales bacterium]|nr:PilZ domain-containing protein [Spirochaetales bacterium]